MWGYRLGIRKARIEDEAPTGYTKLQPKRTEQSLNRLQKAPKDYIKPKKNYTKPQKTIQSPRRQDTNPKILDKSSN